jgi:ribosomal protein S18 acetylase RimI-like enzyme
VAGWQIRAATVDDVEGVLELWRADDITPTGTDTPAYLKALIEGWPGALIIAVATKEQGRRKREQGLTPPRQRVVGSVIASFDGWRGNIYRLAVDPGYRRRGIARALVEVGERQLEKQGAKTITALVEGDHPLAVGFWEASAYLHHVRMRRYFRRL